MTTTARVRANPYIGPHSFQSGDALYGRDQEVGDLLDLLIAERVVLLHSPSGAGKTSLIQARLLWMLRDEGFEVLPVIRLNHQMPPELINQQPPVNRYVLSALLSLEEGVPAHLQRPTSELARLSLAQYVAEWPDLDGRPGNEVLVLDQFEEIITADPVDHEAKNVFFADLGATLRDRSLWALFSMREDFIAELEPYLRHVPTRFSTRFRLDLLSVDQALDAITMPAHDAGVEFQRAAAVKLVDDLRRVRSQRGGEVVEQLGRHVEPVQLQVSCRQIWDRLEHRAALIGPSDIESAGDVNQALAGYYASSVAQVSSETGISERSLRDWFEMELITAQGFRGQVLSGPEAAAGTDAQVLQRLTSAHLLRAESRREPSGTSSRTPRLTQPIQEDNARWRAEHLSGLERKAGEWEQQGRPDRLLLAGRDLEQAQQESSGPTSTLAILEREYLSASIKAERQREDLVEAAVRTRRWLRVSVGLLVLALITAVLATISAVNADRQSERAERAVAEAERAALLADAIDGARGFTQVSILLTLRALESSDQDASATNWRIENALQTALDGSPRGGGLDQRRRGSTDRSLEQRWEEVVTADVEGVLRRIDLSSGAVLARRSVVGDILSVTVDPVDNARVALGLTDGSVLLWDANGDLPPVEEHRHRAKVYEVAFSPDGTLLASAGADGAVIVSRNGRRVARVRLPVEVNAVRWSADGSLVYTVDDSGALTVWDVASGELVQADEDRHSDLAVALDVSDDGKLIASGGWDGRTVITLLDRKAEPTVIPTTSATGVVSVSFTRNGHHLLVLDQLGYLDTVDTATGQVVNTTQSLGQVPTMAAASPIDPARALVTTGDAAAAIWDVELGHDSGLLVAMDINQDGRLMTAAYQDDVVLFWSGDGQQVVDRLQLDVTGIHDAAFDSQGRFVVYTSTDFRARITPLESRWPERELRGDVGVVAVSDSGKLVATGGLQKSFIHVWDTRSGARVGVLKDHTSAVTSIDFGANDSQLVSSSRDNTAIVWDVEHEAVVHRLRGEDDEITAVAGAWSPAGDRIALGRVSGAVELLSPEPGGAVVPLSWHTRYVNDVAFDASGQRLVSSANDGYSVIWNVATGTLERAVPQPSQVYRATFSADGRHLLVDGGDGTPTTVWLDVDELRDVAKARATRGLTETECRRYLPEESQCDES